MDERYAKIINLPHHVSAKHPQMTLNSRAAQFAPFAALSGYSDDIGETVKEALETFTDGTDYDESEDPSGDKNTE